ncbi:MAG: hypothetical protein AB7G11_16125 [Phycisphaerales bacterium]
MATKTKTLPTAAKAYEAISREAERIRNDAYETIETLSEGDTVRQGDLYLVALDQEPKALGPFGTNQLTPGTTQGSRHVVQGQCEVLRVEEREAIAILNRLVPATRKHDRQFIGPMIRASGPVTVTHPEHGDRTLPAGSYLTTYQRAFGEEIRRQAD